jgi:hypothetical protein
MKGIYFIENTVDEWHTRIAGYFLSLEEAKEALKECSDWYRSKGTGTIYFKEFGLGKTTKKVYQV